MSGASSPSPLVGANFTGTTPAGDPPDTDGAVGPNDFVEFLNSRYVVYEKSGTVLQDLDPLQFWAAAGLAPNDLSQFGSFDPRVIYDPDSGRWFACACDLVEEPNRVFLAVSNTSDP